MKIISDYAAFYLLTFTTTKYTASSKDENTDLTMRSAYSNSTQTIDWYSSVTIAETKSKVSVLKVTYDGSYSKTETQNLTFTTG